MITFGDACKPNKPFLELIQLLSPNYSCTGPITDADWVQILEYAKKMQVIPLLYSMLKQKPGISPPTDINNQLKSFYLANSTRNLFLTRDLIRILTSFDKNAIPVIPLKGAYLAHVVYDDPSARQMVDLDIMVKWEDVATAITTLETLGYTATGTYHLDDEYRYDNHHVPGFIHPSGTRVEIHWNIIKASAMGERGAGLEEMFWLRAKPGDILGAKAYFLTPEVIIFHSAIHQTIHHIFNSGIRDFYDLERMYRKFRDDIDWTFLISSANEMKLKQPLQLTLALTDIFTGSDITDELKRKGINIAIPRQYLIFAIDEIVRGGPTYSTAIRVGQMKHGPLERIRCYVDWIVPSRKAMEVKYQVPSGSRIIYLYYPYHLYDLIIRFGMLFRDYCFWKWMSSG